MIRTFNNNYLSYDEIENLAYRIENTTVINSNENINIDNNTNINLINNNININIDNNINLINNLYEYNNINTENSQTLIDDSRLTLPDPSPIFENFLLNLNIPNYLLCPISLQLFKDPLITNDGYTYDREYLLDLLTRTNLSPMTREVITYTTRNRAIRDCIFEFILQQ